jgi:NhaA family Na+:H+ antiporter
MKNRTLFRDFWKSERASGLILIIVSAVSLFLANNPATTGYVSFWHNELAGKSIEFWINDGLMTIFFLMVGLEIERELYNGELSDKRRAMLPALAALGGMLLPAAIHFGINRGTPTQNGFGIPMATDIAFSLAVLGLASKYVPFSLKIFLTALAIIDDVGAIIVIALFYTRDFSVLYFLVFLALFAGTFVLNRFKVHSFPVYLIAGAGMWLCLHNAGVHPAITGVCLAFALPFGSGGKESLSYRIQKKLHYPVAYLVVPLFAMANTAITIEGSFIQNITSSNGAGIALGLTLGKPAGIFLFSMAGVFLGICSLPADLKKIHILGAGCLAGIGFTMSIFITLLAFDDQQLIVASKISIITASIISGLLGIIILKLYLRKK